MRVTEDVKQATRRRILDASKRLFRTEGYDATTTRDIASEAGIATGTLFNYFPNKEAIVLTFVADALVATQKDFRTRNAVSNSIDEDVFAFVAAGLRKLRPFRNCIRPLLDACLNPLTDNDVARSIRTQQLEMVVEILNRHRKQEPLSAIGLHLFWTLYTGVLSFWANDKSPHQEDTLAMLDQSMKMFVNWIDQDSNANNGS